MALPLRVLEPRYLRMVSECLEGGQVLGAVLIKEGEEVGPHPVPYEIGTAARIIGVEKTAQGTMRITAVGKERFRIRRVRRDKPYLVGIVEPFPLEGLDAPEVGTLFSIGVTLLSVYLELLSQVSAVEVRPQRAPGTPEAMAHFVAMLLQVPQPVKQRLLSTADLPAMLRREADLLRGEVSALTVMMRGEEILDRGKPLSRFSTN